MNAPTAAALLADIGLELRRATAGHGDLYDMVVTLTDGTLVETHRMRQMPDRDAYMRRLCKRLLKSGRARRVMEIHVASGVTGPTWTYWPDRARFVGVSYGEPRNLWEGATLRRQAA